MELDPEDLEAVRTAVGLIIATRHEDERSFEMLLWNYLENPRPLFRAFAFLSRTLAGQAAELARMDPDEYLQRMAEGLAEQGG